MSPLLALLARSARVLAAALALGVASGAAGAALIWLVGDILSRAFASSPAMLALYAALCAALLASRVGFLALLGRLQQRAVLDLRTGLVGDILHSPLRRLEQLGPSRVHAALTADLGAVAEALRLLPYAIIHLATCAGCLLYLAWLSPPALVVLAGLGGLGVASYWLPTRAALRVFRRARDREDALFAHYRAATDGIKELRLSAPRRTAFLREAVAPAAADVCALNVRSNDVLSATSSWGVLLFFVFVGGLLFGLPHVYDVDARTLTGFVLALLYLQQPISAVLDLLPLIGRGRIALDRIAALALAPEPVGEPPPSLSGSPSSPKLSSPSVLFGRFRRLRLTGVTHAYHREHEDDRFVLGPIDLEIRRGELIFIVGGNGSGKTTLMKLVTGLYAPESGRIDVDGVMIDDARRDAYRQQFSAVFSEFHVFDSLLGAARDPSTAARIQHYLRRLHLDRKVAIRDGMLSTVALSTGQRKRLALLVAYLEDRPIYVFDEWAADQDPAFKAVFYLELLRELQGLGKTVIVISHDDRYFHVADRVLRLESGRLEPAPPAPLSSEDSACLPQQST